MPHRWNKAAALRREQIETGLDITFNHVFVPYFIDCAQTYRPNKLLEIGCGTGHLAARLAKVVPHVEALEPSPGMHSEAKGVLGGASVALHHISAEEFRSSQRFDLVVSHLCGHVVADIDRFCQACANLINESGTFVFSLPHPCFWSDAKEDFPKPECCYTQEQFAHITLKITKDPSRAIEGVPFHHRPVGRYISALHKVGMALTRLDEIVPTKSVQALYGQKERGFPRYCVLHAKKFTQPYYE